jgi:PAS domain S-box-containing protein
VVNSDQSTDLLRILVADDDDVHAFTLQCAINRLSKACAFLRVDDRELLARKIRSFEPEFLVVSGSFATPGELRQIKQLTNGSPIICLVRTRADAEASLSAGATDCVLAAQEDGLGACLERHLTGKSGEPHFRGAGNGTKGRISSAEEKLEQLDQRLAVHFRKLGTTTQIQWRRMKEAVKLGAAASRSWIEKQYRSLKVKYLIRKQQRLVQKPAAIETRIPEAGKPIFETGAPVEPKIAMEAMEPRWNAYEEAYREENSEQKEALRTLDLSFKTLFHTALDAMFLIDGLGTILHINPAGCALLGATAADILGKSLFNFVPGSDKVRASAMWEAVLIEGQQKTELTLETATGEQREVFLSARANFWFGVHLLIARDQTELKQLRREIETLNAKDPGKISAHQTSTGPLGTGMAERCAEAGSMKDDTSGAGR